MGPKLKGTYDSNHISYDKNMLHNSEIELPSIGPTAAEIMQGGVQVMHDIIAALVLRDSLIMTILYEDSFID